MEIKQKEVKEKLFGEIQTAEEQEEKAIKKQPKEDVVTTITNALNVTEQTKAIMEKVRVNTFYGELNMFEIQELIKVKLLEYIYLGTAHRIQKEVLKQIPQATREEILSLTLEMARFEVLYGLRPFSHTLPIAGKVYVTADGYAYYAKPYLKTIKYDIQKENGHITVTCTATDINGVSAEGTVTVPEAPKTAMDDPLERAKTKARRRALRVLFPIGSGEDFDEFTGKPHQVEQLPPEKIATKIEDLEI